MPLHVRYELKNDDQVRSLDKTYQNIDAIDLLKALYEYSTRRNKPTILRDDILNALRLSPAEEQDIQLPAFIETLTNPEGEQRAIYLYVDPEVDNGYILDLDLFEQGKFIGEMQAEYDVNPDPLELTRAISNLEAQYARKSHTQKLSDSLDDSQAAMPSSPSPQTPPRDPQPSANPRKIKEASPNLNVSAMAALSTFGLFMLRTAALPFSMAFSLVIFGITHVTQMIRNQEKAQSYENVLATENPFLLQTKLKSLKDEQWSAVTNGFDVQKGGYFNQFQSCIKNSWAEREAYLAGMQLAIEEPDFDLEKVAQVRAANRR